MKPTLYRVRRGYTVLDPSLPEMQRALNGCLFLPSTSPLLEGQGHKCEPAKPRELAAAIAEVPKGENYDAKVVALVHGGPSNPDAYAEHDAPTPEPEADSPPDDPAADSTAQPGDPSSDDDDSSNDDDADRDE